MDGIDIDVYCERGDMNTRHLNMCNRNGRRRPQSGPSPATTYECHAHEIKQAKIIMLLFIKIINTSNRSSNYWGESYYWSSLILSFVKCEHHGIRLFIHFLTEDARAATEPSLEAAEAAGALRFFWEMRGKSRRDVILQWRVVRGIYLIGWVVLSRIQLGGIVPHFYLHIRCRGLGL